MFQASTIDEYTRTTEPVVVGPSVLAVRYKGGVLVMADTAATYGSLARYTDLQRIDPINSNTLVAFSGELSDWQYLRNQTLKELVDDDIMANDGIQRTPAEIHSLLNQVLHHYRNKANPLYNTLVTAGINDDGSTYLGFTDLYGTNYVDDYLATGFGSHMSLPLLRQNFKKDMSKEEAQAILEDAMRVLVYRHCRTINKFQIAAIEHNTVTKATDTTISAPYELSTQWNYQRFVNPQKQEAPIA